jgi:hypothetical protein
LFAFESLEFGDEGALRRLSEDLGQVLWLTAESASGTVAFQVFAGGSKIREVVGEEDGVILQGEALAQETDVDLSQFGPEEAERLCRAFGISGIWNLAALAPYSALCIEDRTDYGQATAVDAPSSVAGPSTPSAPVHPEKPWWRFW